MAETRKDIRIYHNIIIGFLPIFFGILIYTLRPYALKICFNSTNLLLVKKFILYNLPDSLWAISFFCVLNVYIKRIIISFTIVITCTIVFELLQHLMVINGTGDLWDIFFSIMFLVPFFIIYK
jgi:hypothetical protein